MFYLFGGKGPPMGLSQPEGPLPHAGGPVHLHSPLPVPSFHKVLLGLLESALPLQLLGQLHVGLCQLPLHQIPAR